MIIRTVSCALALVAATSFLTISVPLGSRAHAQDGAAIPPGSPPASGEVNAAQPPVDPPVGESGDGADASPGGQPDGSPAEQPVAPPDPDKADTGAAGAAGVTDPKADKQAGEKEAGEKKAGEKKAGEKKAGEKKEEKDKDARYGFGWAGLPLLNFNTDNGLGYGVRLVLFDYGKNQRPYKYRWILQFFQSTRGIQFHRIGFDGPRFLGSKWRLDGNIRLDGDHFAPYYGLGGQSEYNADYELCDDRDALEIDPDVCPGNPDFRGLRYYRYSLLMPAGLINVRRDLRKPWQLMASYQLQFAQIETQYPDELGQTGPSRLVEDINNGEPLVGVDLDANGKAGLTRNGTLQVGLVYDTRDNEPAPTSGSWHEFSLRAASPVLGGQFWYWGAHLRLRSYLSLDEGRKLVLAGRLLVDLMGGDVPVYRLSRTGGLASRELVGSAESVRGLLRARYVGKIKMVANGEVRWRFLTVRPGGNRFDMTLVGGLDVGRAWRGFDDEGPFLDAVASTAGGVRFGWNENFVVRVDYAYSITDETTGFYIEFNHLF